MSTPLDGLDPTGLQTPEAFMQLLREARAASGLSLVEIAERARQRGYDLDAPGLSAALERSSLPNWQIVTGLLTACGMGGMQIDRWMRVYRDLAAPVQPTAPAATVAAAAELTVVEPVSVPPLVLKTAPATPVRRVVIVAGVLAALILAPLIVLALSDGGPDTIASQPTPQTESAAPSLSNPPAVPPSTAVPAPTAPVTTTKPPARTTPSPRPAGPSVLRSGTVALTGRQGFDLDSGQSDGELDIFRWNSRTLARLNGSLLEPMSSMPNKQACQAEEGWEAWVGDLQAGQWLCLRTSDGRYGRLNITAVGKTLKLAYTVWT